MIDSQTKQRILDAANILEVVSDFISLRRSGVSYVGLCPFHNDRKPSFYVSPSKNVCKCFSCGEGGSPVHFIMKHEQLSYTDALRYLARKYHIEIVEREETDEERQAANERQSLLLVNEYAQAFFRRQLMETEEGRSVGLAYFQERGLRPETIELFGLGYSPEGRTVLTDEAQSRGYALERLAKVGLSVQYDDGRPAIDRFRGRVIFPIRNLSGQYVAFGGRIMGKSDRTAKYVNSPESAIYSKGRELYGLYQAKGAIAKSNKCYLVEGYTDVISMHQSGVSNVVASSGTALTVQQIRLLRRFTEHVTVLYDGDSAGIKAALRGIDLLLEEGLDIKVVLLPEGEDPDSYARSHSPGELVRYLDEHEQDFIHFKIDLYKEDMKRDPIKRAELITDVLRSIALIPDTIRRTVLLQSSASELRMDERLLMSEVGKLRAQGLRSSATPPPNVAPSSIPRTPEPLPSSPQSPQPEVAETSDSTPYEPRKYELELIRLLMHRGHDDILIYTTDEAEQGRYERRQLAGYVYDELERDGILDLLSPVGHDVILGAVNYLNEHSEGECSAYFTNHDSEVVRRMSADLLIDGYNYGERHQPDTVEEMYLEKVATSVGDEQHQAISDLEAHRQSRSQRHQIELGNITARELDALRMGILMQSIYDVQRELKQAESEGDEELMRTLITELTELNQFKVEFAQSLGDRTIIG